jgi:zinc protease
MREDKHWTYGVSTVLVAARGQRPYLSVSQVQTDKTKESMQELLKEYADISGAKPISARELGEVQAYNTLGLPGRFETAAQLGGAYASILQYGLPEDYYNSFTRKAMALGADEINALARRIIVPGRLAWVVVGDLAKIEAGIRELGLGDVRKLDADGNLLN